MRNPMILRTKTSMAVLSIALLVGVPCSAAVANQNSGDTENTDITAQAIENENNTTQTPTYDKKAATEAATLYVQAQREAAESKHYAAYWETQTTILEEQVESLEIQAKQLQQQAEAAHAEYEKFRSGLAAHAREASRDGGASGLSSTVETFLQGPNSVDKLSRKQHGEEKATQQLATTTLQMQVNKKAAEDLAAEAQVALQEAETLLTKAKAMRTKTQAAITHADERAQEAMEQWSTMWKSIPDTSTQGASTGTQILNNAVKKEWDKYLQDIKKAGITLPTAKELSNVNDYPQQLAPYPALNIDNTGGVAYIDGMTVPTKEAAQRVTTALNALNAPYSPNGDSTTTGWGCEAFTSQTITGKSDTSLTKLYETAGRQLSNSEDATPGDIVFFADPSAGIHHAGVYIFGNLVISSSASTNAVSVEPLGQDTLGVVRPGGTTLFNTAAPKPMPDALPWKCGGLTYEGNADNSATTWLTPIADNYELGTKFGDKTGDGTTAEYLEFTTTKKNTPTILPFDGTIENIKKVKGEGSTITIRHSKTFSTIIAGVSKVAVKEGAKLKAGTPLGITGSKLSTTPNTYTIRITLLTGKTPTNPQHLFFPEKQGKHLNGQIPESELCTITTGGLLRCDAARAFEIMNAAYKEHFGTNMTVTDTYRSLAGQYRCRELKGNLCATPGTSNHGWGLAIDFGGGINKFGTAQHQWMVQNASTYGWVHPDWAQSNGSKPEAWHWEFFAAH